MVQNGRIPATQLTTLLDGQRLINARAVSVLTLVRVGHLLGTHISCPTGGDPGISGYRDLARQSLFLAASRGDRTAALRCNIDPTMKTHVGSVGAQSHGYGDRIDLLFNGRSPNVSDLAMAHRYGLMQEFGPDDANHFRVLGTTTHPVGSDVNRIVCAFLNKQDLGRESTTAEDGAWPTNSNFSWMLQKYGSEQPGWYPTSRFKIDGVAGAQTMKVRNRIMGKLWAS